jgi:lipoate-protein ligase A
MAIDEAVFNACKRGQTPPTFRLYGWHPPAVSIGYGQRLDEELDVDRCRMYGIDIVRRHTGGRAVLHDEEITYALAVPEGHPAIGPSSYDTYRRISEALIRALRDMEIPAQLVARTPPQGDAPDGACFSHAARYEIAVHGRKLAGSAQRRSGGFVLQHGTLLLGPGHKRLPLLLPHHQHERRRRMMEDLNERTVSAAELLGRRIPFHDMAARIPPAVTVHLGIALEAGALSPQEEEEVFMLIEAKYGNPRWTAGKQASHAP